MLDLFFLLKYHLSEFFKGLLKVQNLQFLEFYPHFIIDLSKCLGQVQYNNEVLECMLSTFLDQSVDDIVMNVSLAMQFSQDDKLAST